MNQRVAKTEKEEDVAHFQKLRSDETRFGCVVDGQVAAHRQARAKRLGRTQPRKVSAVQPILAATDPIAAHCDSYSC